MFRTTLLLALAVLGTAGTPHGKPIYVQEGESIQAAIDAAHPGNCITVGPGVYFEQLTISTSGISLTGDGAVLKPPKTLVSNTCSGLAGNDTEAGICVTGSGIELSDFEQEHRKVLSVETYVEGVSITGFEIHNFTGLDIAVVGGKNTKISENTLYDGAAYGFLAVGSYDTKAHANQVASTGDLLFIGMCMDDASPAEYSGNHVSGYLIAYCLQTAGGVLKHNTAENNCVGAFLDPGVTGINVIENHISSVNPGCPPSSPEFVTGGIIIFGATDAKIIGNVVEGLDNNGTAIGLLIADSPPSDLASGNVVKNNIFRNNALDISLFTNATDNVIAQNQCSTPTELCSA